MFSRPQIKHTYSSSRTRRLLSSSSSSSSPPTTPSPNLIEKRKRPLGDSSVLNAPPLKRTKNSALNSTKSNYLKKNASKPTTQLHFIVNKTLQTCSKCSLSFVKGAVEDEALHTKHCLRVQRGLEWGKEEEREADKAGVRVIEDLLRFKDVKGDVFARVISIPAGANGKIGTKLSSLFDTINLSLSAPSLTPEILKVSKVYLFLLPIPNKHRERIVGCVIAQRITCAMNVIPESEKEPSASDVVYVDGGLYCRPELLPTPLGISRLFVSATHRRRGISTILLNATARTFIYGCPLDPLKGQIAFSQPTGDGQKVMQTWGKGGIRIYQE